MLQLKQTTKFDNDLMNDMSNHYSQPKGFVGRSICYKIYYNNVYYGAIVGGSATRFLPGRNEYFQSYYKNCSLENIVNNLFFHIEPKTNKYPLRNFAQKILDLFQKLIKIDWWNKYNDLVLGFETLIQLPRTGEIYIRNNWINVGTTVGYTCKRIADTNNSGTDNWSGKRVWNTIDLKPKLVFCKRAVLFS